MGKLVRGLGACALALGSIAATATTSGGQEGSSPPPLQMALDNSAAARGDRVTVSSVDGCMGQSSEWRVVVTFQVPGRWTETVRPRVAEDGSWSTQWSVLEDKDREPAGEYTVSATCGDNPETQVQYAPLTFTVTDHPEPTEGLAMAIAPDNPVAAGGELILASRTPCPTYGSERVVTWIVIPLIVNGDTIDFGPAAGEGFAVLDAAGNWFSGITAPTDGAYGVYAACGRRSFTIGGVSGILHTGRTFTSFYDGLLLLVGDAPAPGGGLPGFDDFSTNPAPAPAVAGRAQLTG